MISEAELRAIVAEFEAAEAERMAAIESFGEDVATEDLAAYDEVLDDSAQEAWEQLASIMKRIKEGLESW